MPEIPAPSGATEDPTVTALVSDLREVPGVMTDEVRYLLNEIWYCDGDLAAVETRLSDKAVNALVNFLVAELQRQQESRIEAYRYALARTTLELLRPTSPVARACPYLGRIPRWERESVLTKYGLKETRAAVAVPVVLPEAGEPYFAVSRRSIVNGYDGGPMSNAGDVVLFGGAADPNEALAVAAVRELLEETGVVSDVEDLGFGVLERLSQWRTEAGHRVEGYLVDSPVGLAANVRYDAREVSDVGTVALRDLYAADLVDRYHLGALTTSDRAVAAVGWFASPTGLLPDRDGVRQWLIWGVAGITLSCLVNRYTTVDSLLGAMRARRSAVRNRSYVPSFGGRHRLDQFRLAAYRARSFMSRRLGIGTAQIVRSPLLSKVLDETSLLVLDTGLGWGSSTKTRAICGYVYGLVESGLSGPDRHYRDSAEVLRTKLDGAVLVVGSSGSHAYAVAQFANWLRSNLGIEVSLEVFLSADITPSKRRAIESCCEEVILVSDFNAAMRAAQSRMAYIQSTGHSALLLASDPDCVYNAQLSVSSMDAAIGLATLVLDLQSGIGTGYHELGLDSPVVDELRVPTSGGATWASCVAVAAAALLDIGHDFRLDCVTAAYDVAAPVLRDALRAGDPTLIAEVDWSTSINGLAQPEIAPGAWSLLLAAESTDPALLHPVSAAAARVGAAVIELETGTRVQLAAGAAVGSRLLEAVAHASPQECRSIFASLAGAGVGQLLDDSQAVFATLADQAQRADAPMLLEPRKTRCYLVSGAEIDS